MDKVLSEGFVGLILALAGGISTFFKSFKFVQEGSLGVRLRFGKVVRDKENKPVIIPPGFVFLIPWVDTLVRRHIRQQTIRLENQRIILKDGLVYVVSAIVLYKVIDVYKALFEIDDLDSSLIDFSQGILRDVTSTKDHTSIGSSEEVSTELLQKIKTQGEAWGVEFLQFKLVDNAPSAETANIVNVEIGAKMKLQALTMIANELKVPIEQLNSVLAGVLVGVPLVASVSQSTNTKITNVGKDTQEESQ